MSERPILPFLPPAILYRGRGGVRIRGGQGLDSPSPPITISASSMNIKHISWKQNPKPADMPAEAPGTEA